MTPGEHQAAVAAAHQAATALRDQELSWHVVACHYAALHLIHADLLGREDLPAEMRSPERHRSRWGYDGQRIAWGINDVVRHAYPDDVSRPFTSLVTGSHAVRYCAPFAVGDRLWNDYLAFRKAFGL